MEHIEVKLKDGKTLYCPMCKLNDTLIKETVHNKPNTPRWFYHYCCLCEFAAPLSIGVIIEDADGNLIANVDEEEDFGHER